MTSSNLLFYDHISFLSVLVFNSLIRQFMNLFNKSSLSFGKTKYVQNEFSNFLYTHNYVHTMKYT